MDQSRDVEQARRLLRRMSQSLTHPEQVALYCSIILQSLSKEWLAIDEIKRNSLVHQLHMAALLHDIGHAIANHGHHKHTRYLIMHSDVLHGWDDTFRRDIAAIAFSHRKKAEKSWLTSHFFGDINLMKLAAILRIADGLDRSHRGHVQIHDSFYEGNSFIIQVSSLRPEFKQHVLTKKADLWREAFPYSLVLKA